MRILWPDEEVATAMTMRANGALYREIASALPGFRTPNQVRSQIEYRSMTPEQKRARAERISQYRLRHALPRREVPRIHTAALVEVDPAVFRDRDTRNGLRPRDLTAAFCGDPLPGYSALDRRST